MCTDLIINEMRKQNPLEVSFGHKSRLFTCDLRTNKIEREKTISFWYSSDHFELITCIEVTLQSEASNVIFK